MKWFRKSRKSQPFSTVEVLQAIAEDIRQRGDIGHGGPEPDEYLRWWSSRLRDAFVEGAADLVSEQIEQLLVKAGERPPRHCEVCRTVIYIDFCGMEVCGTQCAIARGR